MTLPDLRTCAVLKTREIPLRLSNFAADNTMTKIVNKKRRIRASIRRAACSQVRLWLGQVELRSRSRGFVAAQFVDSSSMGPAPDGQRALVGSDADVMGGVPCFVDTRVPIESVLASLAAGSALQDLRKWCPSLTDEHILAARAYMRDHPEKTSRESLGELNPNWQVVERRQVRLPSAVRIGSAIGLFTGWDDIHAGDAEILEMFEALDGARPGGATRARPGFRDR